MPQAPIPDNDRIRLAALAQCKVLDTEPEPTFDAMTRLAARVCETPIALVSLVDRDRQWFKSRVGLDVDETPRDQAFCGYSILSDEMLVITDAATDPRTADNPLVLGGPKIRFYAGVPLCLSSGEALGTLCVIDTQPRELTEAARESLRELAIQATELLESRRRIERFERAVDGSSDGLWDHDPVTGTVWYSDRFKELVGRDPRDPDSFPHVIASWMDLLHPDDSDRVLAAVDAHLEDDASYDIQYRLRMPTGDYRWFRARAKTVRNDRGEPIWTSGSMTDVNDVREAEAQLEQKNEELESFVYTASHDLKSPIVTMLGYVGHLMRDLESRQLDELVQYGQRIRGAAERMRANIDDMLELSRIGRARIDPKRLEFPALVARIWESVALSTGTEAALETSFDVDAIEMDETLATSLLQNLLGNAAKYGCSGPVKRVEVGSMANAEGGVSLYVRDHGPGIEAKYRDQAFELFERLTSEPAGTGVGLAIVRRVVDLNGGRAWIDETPGGGTTVWVELPPAANASRASAECAA